LNLSLTAQAVIALKMNTDINGFIKDDITDAIDRGRMWLEKYYRVDTFCFCYSKQNSLLNSFSLFKTHLN